jgi:cell division septal protein FtsQ
MARAATAGRLPRRVAWPRRLAAALVVAAVLAAGYMLWLRDSSLVAVKEVRIEGLTSLTDPRAAGALESAALEMTTLHVEVEELGAAVAEYPTIASLSASPSFPNGLEVTVVERPPVAVAGPSEIPVAADGMLLPGVDVGDAELPAIEAAPADGGGVLDDEGADQAAVLGAAPGALAPVIERVTADGLEVELEGGISLRFGDASRAAAKWAAGARILADPSLDALTYIDLRVPGRPAVGGAAEAAGVTEPLPPG